MALNAIELTGEIQARTSFDQRDASGIAYAITRAVEVATAPLVTKDYLDLRLGELRGELKTDIANLRVEMNQLIRMQTAWMAGTMIAVGGLIIAAVKLLP